jgi:transposase
VVYSRGMSKPAATLAMSESQREILERLAASQTAADREVQRARVLLLAADGVANAQITTETGVTPVTVRAWRKRFAEQGLTKFGKVAPGRGRPPEIPQDKIEEIVDLTRNCKPKGEAHWSTRTMAKEVGVSKATVQRVWSARGLKPHLVKTFKLSNDPTFEEKLIDVVGLYLNPPEQAMVLCMDEKSSVQALDRTQPSLPMKKGRAGTMTHDYKRHGTTTLFAALDVLTGKVIGQCLPRHRHTEFLKFLKTINAEVPAGLEIHLVLDNYSTHKHAKVKAWLAKHPRTRLAINELSSARARRERYVGEWLPEPIITGGHDDPARHAETADSLSQPRRAHAHQLGPPGRPRPGRVVAPRRGQRWPGSALSRRTAAADRRMGARHRRQSDHKHQLDRQPRQADAPRASRRLQIAIAVCEMIGSANSPTRTSDAAASPAFPT